MSKRNYHLKLRGYVGGWNFNSNDVDSKLSKMEGQEVSVLIDSYGGSVATGLSISSYFRNHGKVTVHFVGMNASAATVASMGAAHVSIDRSAMYLVHKSSQTIFEWDALNADQLEEKIKEYQRMKADLDKIDLNIAALYAARCKRPVKDLLELMKEGAWLSAQEALEWGFVDEITEYEEDMPPVLHESMANAISMWGQPLPDMPVMPDPATGFFRKLETMISNVFNSNKNKIESMKKVFTNICALLGCADILINDKSASLTEEDLDKIEAHIASLEAKIKEGEDAVASKDSEINALRAELENLKKKPATDTSNVIDPEKKAAPEASVSEMEEYVATAASATKLFNSLP